jgi:predicted CoA-binding protein
MLTFGQPAFAAFLNTVSPGTDPYWSTLHCGGSRRHARGMRTVTEPWAEPETIEWILGRCQTWAIVGLGNNPGRAAFGVARMLQSHGKRIVPVHPRAETVLGEPGYRDLADIPFDVDCVDVFRRAEDAGPFADEAVAIGAKAVWFQLDIIDEAAFARTTEAGLRMVMDRCPAIEWPRYGPPSQ